MKYSILVPTFNNFKYLKFLCDSLEKNSSNKHQIIIHVNDGADGSYDYVKNKYKYTYSKENIGLCSSLKHASKLIENDYVIYVYAKKSKIIERLKLRKGFNIQIYNNLKKIQLSNEYKKNRSKLIIKNNFNKKSLKKVIFMIKREIFLK